MNRTMEQDYDVIVIGAGPAGCRAASVLAENGKRTALVESRAPGGTCLRAGCIPTKKLSLAAALLRRNLLQEDEGSPKEEEEVRDGGAFLQRDKLPLKSPKEEEEVRDGRAHLQKGGRSLKEKAESQKGLAEPGRNPGQASRRAARQSAWQSFLLETARTAKEMAEGIRLVQMSRRVRLLEGEEAFPERGPQGLYIKAGGEDCLARDVILATGTEALIPETVLRSAEKNPAVSFYTTDTLWEMKTLPDRLIVIGGGTAGCEIADAMSAFVPAVELYEAGEQILADWSREPRRAVRRILEKHGVRIQENCQASGDWLDEVLKSRPAEAKNDAPLGIGESAESAVCSETSCGEEKAEEDTECCSQGLQDPDPVYRESGHMREESVRTAVVTAAGRRPVFPARKASALGLSLTQNGYIRADSTGRTAIPHVYCIGDANGQEKTAYYGTWQAEQAAERILHNDTGSGEGGRRFPDPDRNGCPEAEGCGEWERMYAPSCLHTDPPAACVGMTMEEVRALGYNVRTGRAPVYASGAARSMGYTDGSVTVWRDPETDLLLGACVIAPEAEELIHLLQSYILFRIPCSLICRQVFAHPSVSELVRMAVEDACGGSAELPAKRRR